MNRFIPSSLETLPPPQPPPASPSPTGISGSVEGFNPICAYEFCLFLYAWKAATEPERHSGSWRRKPEKQHHSSRSNSEWGEEWELLCSWFFKDISLNHRGLPAETLSVWHNGEIGSKLRQGQTLQEGGDKGVDGGTRGELELYKKHKAVEASLYEKEKEAAAQKAIADGELYAKQKEAEGLIAVAQAQGTYIRTLLGAFGGNYTSFRDYLMINGGMFQEIAKINGEAVKGLQLKISIWTGAGGSGGDVGDGGATKEVTGVYKMLSPLFNTVHEQTGMEQLLTGQLNRKNGASLILSPRALETIGPALLLPHVFSIGVLLS
ncbi:hypothetical protein L1887_15304 [Cichorium endivia]|nr:hypothetical protein L1887_15304 [Cichorium endivia]